MGRRDMGRAWGEAKDFSIQRLVYTGACSIGTPRIGSEDGVASADVHTSLQLFGGIGRLPSRCLVLRSDCCPRAPPPIGQRPRLGRFRSGISGCPRAQPVAAGPQGPASCGTPGAPQRRPAGARGASARSVLERRCAEPESGQCRTKTRPHWSEFGRTLSLVSGAGEGNDAHRRSCSTETTRPMVLQLFRQFVDERGLGTILRASPLQHPEDLKNWQVEPIWRRRVWLGTIESPDEHSVSVEGPQFEAWHSLDTFITANRHHYQDAHAGGR